MDRKTMLQLRDDEVLPYLPTNLIGMRNQEMSRRDRRTISREVAFRVLKTLKEVGGTMKIADLIDRGGPIGLGRAPHEIAEGIDYGEELCMFSRDVLQMTLTAEV
jgi:hypothetical protein